MLLKLCYFPAPSPGVGGERETEIITTYILSHQLSLFVYINFSKIDLGVRGEFAGVTHISLDSSSVGNNEVNEFFFFAGGGYSSLWSPRKSTIFHSNPSVPPEAIMKRKDSFLSQPALGALKQHRTLLGESLRALLPCRETWGPLSCLVCLLKVVPLSEHSIPPAMLACHLNPNAGISENARLSP